MGGVGAAVTATRKIRNVAAGRRKVALVVDDLVSLQPFIARAIRVYGVADEPVERTGVVGPGRYSRISADFVELEHMAGEPAGETWCEPRRAVHG